VLILGSMPGDASLRAHAYYAHPRNLFWPLMAELHGFSADAPYDARCAALVRSGIALWDVLASCRRSGSLDTAIARDSEVANDIAAFVRAHPTVRAVLLNGAKAATSLMRHHPDLQIPCFALPSTSPANAGMSRAHKKAAWAAAFSSL
jgi:hypoxanthine-DNA glycosylase